MPILDQITDAIGKTPIIKLSRLSPEGRTVFAKLEASNPGGSVKDRLALAIVLDAERRGLLNPGDTIVECTSGNVGIALAMVAASRGYKFVAVMGDTYSTERRKLIRAYGGRLVLFPGEIGTAGGNEIADRLAEKHGWFRARQFENPANPAYHRDTTASEILEDFANDRLDYFVAGFGTCGTLSGVGEMLKTSRPGIRVIGVEPENAAVVSGAGWNVHRIQGLAPNFVPPLLRMDLIDKIVTVNEGEARDAALRLAAEEGIFVGVSAGAAVAKAIAIAESATEGSNILTVLPDTGERYLSTYVFDDMNTESDVELRDDDLINSIAVRRSSVG